jgi:hypothetical protein
MMARCPVCQSLRIVLVIAPTRRAFCTGCGARWVQEGSVQRAIELLLPRSGGAAWTADGDRSA